MKQVGVLYYVKCTNSHLVIHFLNFALFASSIGTFNYNLARFLCDLLSPLVPNDYSCRDTFSFVSQFYLLKFYLRYVDDILAAFDKEQDSLNFLNVLNKRHPNIKLTIEKQINHSIAFLDVFISGINNQNLALQTYHKSTYIGLLLNFKSFTSFSYKISLIKCLIDRSFKICNNWNSFHNDIENIKSNHIKNA